MMDLFTSFAGAATARHHQALIAAGVPSEWLYGGPARFGVARAVFAGPHWEPHEHGTAVCVLPDAPLSRPGEPADLMADLIAFRTADPARWWLLKGGAAILNPTARDLAEWHGEPLAVHASPLDWMRAGGGGVVVLDWTAHLPLHLGRVPLVAADLALGERLDRALNRPTDRTEISVMRRAAA
ncbi:hypothetical protein [Caenispirillum salinarum]|uniref:hypothetical protein n=1 Tax=Caenispirillum salinarum TaxID=859058 RepID=UPI00384E1EA9